MIGAGLKVCDLVNLQAVIRPGSRLVTACRQEKLWIARCLATALDIRGTRTDRSMLSVVGAVLDGAGT